MASVAASHRLRRVRSHREITKRVSVLCFSTAAQPSSSPETPPNPVPDSPSPVSRLVSLLRNSDPHDWTSKPELHEFLRSDPSPNSVLQISRQLGTAQKARQFFDIFRAQTSPSPHHSFSQSLAFQAILEHTSRESGSSPAKLYELFCSGKENGIPLSINSAMVLIRCFMEAQMFQESIHVFDELFPESRNKNVVNTLLVSLVRGGRVDYALKVLDEMLQPGVIFRPNQNTMEMLLSEIWRTDGRGMEASIGEDGIDALVSRFGDHGLFPGDIWTCKLVNRFCWSGRCYKAWDFLHKMIKSGASVNTRACNALLTGLGKKHDFQKMNMLTKEMKEKGIAPNVATFGILINHLCKLHRVDEALQVLEEMKGGNEGIPSVHPDTVIYNTLIDGLCKVGRTEEGVALMEKMKSEETGCSPNAITYNSLINGFCRSGEIEISVNLFLQMTENGIGPSMISYNTLLDGMCKHGRVGSAMNFFNEMKEKGVKGNAVSYTILITAFSSVSNIEKAMQLFTEMTQCGCHADAVVYYSLISGLSQAGRMDDACLVLSEMKDAKFSLDITGYNILIAGFCRRNNWEKVQELLQELEQNGIKPDCVTFNTLISFFCKKGDLPKAQRLAKKMKEDGVGPTVVTYGALIHAYCAGGKMDEAMKMFETMWLSSKVLPNTVIYNILIESLCKSDKVEEALSLMNDDMKAKGVTPNATTCNSILKGLRERNWFERAFEVMDQMSAGLCDPDYVTLEILTEWLSAIGQTDKLRAFVEGHQVSNSGV